MIKYLEFKEHGTNGCQNNQTNRLVQQTRGLKDVGCSTKYANKNGTAAVEKENGNRGSADVFVLADMPAAKTNTPSSQMRLGTMQAHKQIMA